MNEIQDIGDAYIEIAKLLKKIEGIHWVDLWADQLAIDPADLPFGMPAIFIEFSVPNPGTIGGDVQDLPVIFNIYLVDHILADTYEGSINQKKGLEFIQRLKQIHHRLQGKKGENFSSLDRVSINPVPGTRGAYLAYVQTYVGKMIDYTGQKEYSSEPAPALEVEEDPNAPQQPQNPMFDINV